MFARLLAAFCLLHFAVPLRAGSDDPAASELVVHLRDAACQSAHTVEIMKHELVPLMLSAGYRVAWQDAQSGTVSTSAMLVVVELHGACGADTAAADTKTLASTASSDGMVLPFSSINCAAISRVLAPALASEAGARRDFLYGRAMARVLAHELYHILANTRDHDREGIAKSHFTFTDLLTERFEFERTTLAKLQRASIEDTAVTSTADGASGRN